MKRHPKPILIFTGLYFLTTAAGCIPWAWFTPPSKLTVGGGGFVGESQESGETDSQAYFRLAAGLHPLQLAESLEERRFDFGIGYNLLYAPKVGDPAHGLYADISWIFFSGKLASTGLDRGQLSVSLRPRMRLPYPEKGYGVAIQLNMEALGYANGGRSGSIGGKFCGAASAAGGVGEGGIGLYISTGYSFFYDRHIWEMDAGIVFRIPMSAGAGIAGCPYLLSLSDLPNCTISDKRLKKSIRTLADSKYSRIGLRGVSWIWNETANEYGLYGRGEGVIAQEVEKLYPFAVITGRDGYKMVNYGILDSLIQVEGL